LVLTADAAVVAAAEIHGVIPVIARLVTDDEAVVGPVSVEAVVGHVLVVVVVVGAAASAGLGIAESEVGVLPATSVLGWSKLAPQSQTLGSLPWLPQAPS
jgi:hypothetical protein